MNDKYFQVVWFWKYAMSLLEQTNQTSRCSHLVPASSQSSSAPENETLLHLLQLLPSWPSAAKSSVIETCLRATFDDSMIENPSTGSRPPAGFLVKHLFPKSQPHRISVCSGPEAAEQIQGGWLVTLSEPWPLPNPFVHPPCGRRVHSCHGHRHPCYQQASTPQNHSMF